MAKKIYQTGKTKEEVISKFNSSKESGGKPVSIRAYSVANEYGDLSNTRYRVVNGEHQIIKNA